VLNLRPGPLVGRAYKYLLELRLDEGPLGEEAAVNALRTWWGSQAESQEAVSAHPDASGT
jgi:poly(A) polymerase